MPLQTLKEMLDSLLIDRTSNSFKDSTENAPSFTGLNPYPTWEQVVFSACHNKKSDLKGKRRLENWTDGSWRELIEDFKKRI